MEMEKARMIASSLLENNKMVTNENKKWPVQIKLSKKVVLHTMCK